MLKINYNITLFFVKINGLIMFFYVYLEIKNHLLIGGFIIVLKAYSASIKVSGTMVTPSLSRTARSRAFIRSKGLISLVI